MITQKTSVIPNLLGQPNLAYHDDRTGRNYRRIYGGLSWPSVKAGAIVVLGESLLINENVGENSIWVVAEYESRDPAEIFVKCREFVTVMKVQEFFGDTYNRPMMSLKHKSKAGFNLEKAPFVDEALSHEAYLSIIRTKTSATHKVLNFDNSKAIREELTQLTSVPARNTFKTEYPYIAALGYALAAFMVNEYGDFDYHPEMSYQPLDPEVGM
jgi:hypothetical protein